MIDTNVWISALLNPHGHPARLIRAFREGLFEVAASEPLLREVEGVLRRPRIRDKYQLEADMIAKYLELIREQVILVETTGALQLCRDPHDDFLLETALWGDADYIVTRDDDLKRDPSLVGKLQAGGIQVMSVRQFLDVLTD